VQHDLTFCQKTHILSLRQEDAGKSRKEEDGMYNNFRLDPYYLEEERRLLREIMASDKKFSFSTLKKTFLLNAMTNAYRR